MKKYILLTSVLSVFAFPVQADLSQLIPESTIDVLARETSGISAKRNLDTITLDNVGAYLVALESIQVIQ